MKVKLRITNNSLTSQQQKCLKTIRLVGKRVTQTHKNSSWRTRTRSAAANFKLESLYEALDECQLVLRSWQTLGTTKVQLFNISNVHVGGECVLRSQQNFFRVFPAQDGEIVDSYLGKLSLVKSRLQKHFEACMADIFPVALPIEVVRIIWEHSQCAPMPKYQCNSNGVFDESDARMSFVELKTIVSSIYCAVIRLGPREPGLRNLDHLRPMIDTCMKNLEKIVARR